MQGTFYAYKVSELDPSIVIGITIPKYALTLALESCNQALAAAEHNSVLYLSCCLYMQSSSATAT